MFFTLQVTGKIVIVIKNCNTSLTGHYTHAHTHPFRGHLSRTTRVKQETVSGSGISWAICKSAPRSRQITMPATHHSVFLQAGCPSCRPTNSVKALKALTGHYTTIHLTNNANSIYIYIYIHNTSI